MFGQKQVSHTSSRSSRPAIAATVTSTLGKARAASRVEPAHELAAFFVALLAFVGFLAGFVFTVIQFAHFLHYIAEDRPL